MAFGYQEADYAVEREAVVQSSTGKQTMQIRVSPGCDPELRKMLIENKLPFEEPRHLERYIALEGPNIDLLLLYTRDQEAGLEADWERLKTDPDGTALLDLHWDQYVQGHGLGRTRTGATIMY